MAEQKRTTESLPFIDRAVDFLFSRDNRKWLLLIVLFGFILRLIVASNLPPVEDESGSITHAIGFSRLAPLSQMAQAQVWYYLTDYSFRIFGVHLLMGRILSVIFGTLSIIMVYLLTRRIFDERAGLIAAFILAVSAFHITWTASYQDQTMMFFVLCASYFFLKTYRETGKISLVSAIFLAIAELVKIITGVFIIVFGVFSLVILYKNYSTNRKLFRENMKRVAYIIIILAVAMLPIFAYNYFLYKEKGIVDLPFAQFLRINPEFYMGPGLHHGEGFVLFKLPRNLYIVLTLYFLHEDALTFLLGALGIVYFFSTLKKKTFEKLFFLGMFFFALCFIASAIVLQTHYTSFFPLFALFGAGFIHALDKHPQTKNYGRLIVLGLLCVLLAYNLWSIHQPLTSRSATEKLRSFAINSIDDNTLVIVDSRIYRGTLSWMLSGTHYVESSYFPELVKISRDSNQSRPVKTMFVECVQDDCGWGTIKDQPELNETVEAMARFFQQASKPVVINGGGSISGVRGIEIRGQPFFRVYQTTLQLDPRLINAVDQTHSHFYYHIPRNEYADQAFDHYTVKGGLNKLLNFVAYAVLYACVFLAALSMLLPFYLLAREKDR